MRIPIHLHEEINVIELNLPDMSCGHCASAVAQACKQVDPAAKVEVDLDTKRVKIDSAEETAAFADALSEAGYPPAA
jgi:copper chaperone